MKARKEVRSDDALCLFPNLRLWSIVFADAAHPTVLAKPPRQPLLIISC